MSHSNNLGPMYDKDKAAVHSDSEASNSIWSTRLEHGAKRQVDESQHTEA